MSIFYENFIALCNRKNVSPSVAAEACGVSRGSVTKWKNGSVPRDAVLRAIADYFGVSVSDLAMFGYYGDPEKETPPLEYVQSDVDENARAARRVQIFERTARLSLAQLEQLAGMLDVMFPEEG